MVDTISTYLWPGQTQFGFGAVGRIGQEVRALHANSVFILTDPGIVSARLNEPIVDSLEAAKLPYTLYDQIPANPDIGSVDAATAVFRDSGADAIVAVGGGSVLEASATMHRSWARMSGPSRWRMRCRQ
jgi:alcohol dehydrogenase class IV